MNHASLLRTYFFIRRKRRAKKRRIRKMAFGVMVDKTTAVYLLILAAYAFASIFILSDVLDSVAEWFTVVEEIGRERFWFILTILPIRYVNQAFTKPGVTFSSSEFQLSLLPYKRKSIWLMSALLQWGRQLVILGVTAVAIIYLTGLSFQLVFSYAGLLMFYNVIMTIPQWKLFQMHIVWKIGTVVLLIIVNGVGVLTHPAVTGVLLLGVILGLNILWTERLFKNIDWKRVTESSDFAIWSMMIVDRASGVKMKQNRLYNIFDKVKLLKRPLDYKGLSICRRIWLLYLGKNYQLLLQLIGALLVLMFFTLYLGKVYFHIGAALAIYMYTQSARALFIDRFHHDIVQILPWPVKYYKKAFLEWMLYLSIPFVLPISLYAMLYGSLWLPVTLLLYGTVFVLSFEITLKKAISIVAKHRTDHRGEEFVMALGLICVGATGYLPILSLSFMLFGWLLHSRYTKVVAT
ncbi:hypothetical protein JNUCC1_02323 [Lentibacillus sp. JNUCC-1]|uniref:hypothetical protein n=1 Tax=Lentibacillus sp. JNUCC-1 TaxID=2654513 RepID=UPI0012E78E90|nr:hypothetical protein [Lentibacillus sp. JNUCC-1]MUV38485.1 hypothetical protein [Lentibacillus sp. JNUCC-1]